MRAIVVSLLLANALAAACSDGSPPDGALATVAPTLTQAAATPLRPPATPTALDPAATSTPRPTPEATPVVRFNFRSITQDDQALIVAGIDIGARYLRAATGERAASIQVYASGSLQTLAQMFAATPAAQEMSGPGFANRIAYGVAEAHPGAVFVFTGAELWRASNAVQRVRAVVHEYMHVFQFEAMGTDFTRRSLGVPVDQPRLEGPSWLFEGAADLLSWRAIEAAGLTSVAAQLDSWKSRLAGSDLSPRRMEAYLDYLAAGPDAIGLALLAVDLLMGADDGDLPVRYFDGLRLGVPWQETFAATFGRTPEQFYAQWEAYRATGFKVRP